MLTLLEIFADELDDVPNILNDPNYRPFGGFTFKQNTIMETVKITATITKTMETSFELPKYFKHLQSYYMVLDESTILAISDFDKPHYRSAGLLSSIRHDRITNYYADNAPLFESITEEEFREVFVKVTVELEALMN